MNDSLAASKRAAEYLRGPLINRRVYTDTALFEREMTQLFGRAWIVLGHECQLPEPGSYFLGRVARTPVIVVRDESGEVHVLENRCAHRGPAVCAEPTGKLKRFVCPYHAWNYGLDGRLLSTPLREEYGSTFPWDQRGLARVPRVGRYRGFIFASLSARGPGLEEFLGEARRGFDEFVDRSPSAELEHVGPPLRYRVRANWKVILENLNDILHPLFAHASAGAAVRAMPDPSQLHPLSRLLAAPPTQSLQGFQSLKSTMSAHGHSFVSGIVAGAAGTPPRDAYFTALAERHGEDGALGILQSDLHVLLLYPSATFTPRFQALRFVRPLAVDETEVEAHLYRLKGAPPQVFALALEYGYTSSSPASPVIVDDLEIYERLQAEATADTWMSAERRFGECQPTAGGGASAVATSEEYLRRQYAIWARYLDGPAP